MFKRIINKQNNSHVLVKGLHKQFSKNLEKTLFNNYKRDR